MQAEYPLHTVTQIGMLTVVGCAGPLEFRPRSR